METQAETQRPNNGELIYVPHKDTIRLLEVYVKRSLSLNDGALTDRKAGRKEKWVTMPRKQRRHSSDPSIHLALGSNDEEIGPFSVVEPPADQPENRTVLEESEKPATKPKKKKPSFWKNLFGIFSRKSNEEKDEEEDSPSEVPEVSQAEVTSVVTSCVPTTPVSSQKRKSMRRRSIKRRLSKRLISVTKPHLNPADITRVEEAVSVEPTYAYFEKVSQELEKIVHEVKEKEEVKPLSDEEVINRIIALTIEQGDAIDNKLRDNPTLNNFFQRMSYSAFKKLADEYLEKEATPTQNPPTVLPTAPELVKLAFTYDFTAKIARLSKQNVGHITGLGNRYLQDRFEYKQAMSDHALSDSDG